MIVITYLGIFLCGIIVGGFLNICISRILRRENILRARWSCIMCGTEVDRREFMSTIPSFFYGVRCKHCLKKISFQLLIVTVGNGFLWGMTFALEKDSILSLLYCFMISGLIVLSVIDLRTYEIPSGINVFLAIIGLLCEMRRGFDTIMILDITLVSGFLFLIFLCTKGRGIGGGDIKLMATVGLILGWKLALVALFWGCLYALLIHSIRVIVYKAEHTLALGGYLSAGIITTTWFAEKLLKW